MVRNCELTNNAAGAGGGAINSWGRLTIDRSTFAYNRAAIGGGAVQVRALLRAAAPNTKTWSQPRLLKPPLTADPVIPGMVPGDYL